MKTELHPASQRGFANHGWLNAKHYFSFASYYNPRRMHFGALRVINDDTVAGGGGFATHPHDNMEIITIPTSGALAHKDSMGNGTTIESGDIQVMSAGTGIQHSEFNASQTQEVKLFQIWVIPNQRNVTPRYDQIKISSLKKENEIYQILSPNKEDQGVWIHQNAWFFMGDFSSDTTLSYTLQDPKNGVFVLNIEGEFEVENQKLSFRDALGIWETPSFEIKAQKNSKILLMEVPMEF
ncbi:MAG: hypothetical protein C4K58_05735 [Flavobacteriaceae bacterium]|nr:MAG: hypothetical protein C4K58_05735 [Flavobacteriaceae bacterium]